MSITISDLQYADAENKLIRMTITGWKSFPPISFHYDPKDKAPLTEEVRKLVDGGQYEIAPFAGERLQ